MERGHVLQSLPMQQMIAGSCPNWWNINNMTRPPPNYPQQLPTPSTNILIPPNSIYIPQHMPPSSSSSSSSCHDNQDQLPESWSQLLLGGGVMGEEDNSCMRQNIQGMKLENWEEQILQHHSPNELVKQDNSTRSYVYGHGEIDRNHHHDEYQAVTMASWSQVAHVSSPKSSCTTNPSNLSTNMLDFSNKKKDRKRSPLDHSYECNSTATGGALKKARVQLSSFQSTIKVRKEKLGDRVTALHQLVSPFGKTDTASVLLEAIGYIRFLENQVEALSLPYLSNGGANKKLQQSVNVGKNSLFLEDPGQLLNDNSARIKGAPPSGKDLNEEPKKDLRSRGLCLVPLSCTLQVGSDNSADYWAPSLGGGFR